MKKHQALVVVFLGSMLLFGIQPMLGGTLLPRFGGSAAVWTVCLASYQTLLFVGYFYAHLISRKSLRSQRSMHLILLGVATLWSAGFYLLLPGLKNLIGSGTFPALRVLFCVLFIVGLPYVLLSAGSTLIQVWVSRSRSGSGSGVYRLYAVSNLGSFAGLFAYPLLLEPSVSLRTQWLGFAILMGVYTALLARYTPKEAMGKRKDKRSAQKITPPDRRIAWLWFFLPACSVFLLNALTAHITLDIMPIPLLWAILLALFLLSYVVGFSGIRAKWYVALPFLVAGFSILSGAMSHRLDGAGMLWDLFAILGLCFFGPLFLHHWLYELRPQTEHLTFYYLGNAAGGAVGGLSASILAPILFKTVAEYPLSLLLLAVALAVYAVSIMSRKRWLAVSTLLASAAPLVAAGYIFFWLPGRGTADQVVWRDRGFFGTLKVKSRQVTLGNESGAINSFYHGNTLHGIQIHLSSHRRMPTAYYTVDSGGLAITQHYKYKKGEPIRVALVGLGTGTLAAYGRTNDFYRAYDISPEVVNMATNPALFSFVSDSPADIDIVLCDARKSLEAERDADEPLYDVIYLDAFSGDNIPRHLSTQEAFQLYFDRLEQNGILAVHFSNRYMALPPLMRAVGKSFNCPVLMFGQDRDVSRLKEASYWAFFSKNPPKDFAFPESVVLLDNQKTDTFILPTDEKGSFLGLIRRPWRTY